MVDTTDTAVKTEDTAVQAADDTAVAVNDVDVDDTATSATGAYLQTDQYSV